MPGKRLHTVLHPRLKYEAAGNSCRCPFRRSRKRRRRRFGVGTLRLEKNGLRLRCEERVTMKSKESKNGVKQNRKQGEQSGRMSEYSAGGGANQRKQRVRNV